MALDKILADSIDNTITANVAALNVGANLNLTTTRITVGNSTVNSFITSTGVSSSNANITYAPATATGYAVTLTAKDTQGGTGYADFLKMVNNTSGVTNGNKSLRMNSTGGIEILNNAYTTVLLSLSDAGVLSTGQLQISGKKAVNGPAFSAYPDSGTTQTITSGPQTKVLFQNEEFDTDSCFASSRFTPNVEGYFQLNATVRIDGTMGTGECMIILYKNGSEYKRGWNSSGTVFGSNFWAMGVNSVAYANGTTDYFEIYVQQTSGSNRNITVAGANITYFNGVMMRGA